MNLKTKPYNKGVLNQKSFQFAICIVNTCKALQCQKEFVLSKQLLRSGTSIGAMLREAINAESTKDFIHKLSIAQKEADETIYWLDLLYETNYINESEYNDLFSKAKEVVRMITSSIVTSKKKLGKY